MLHDHLNSSGDRIDDKRVSGFQNCIVRYIQVYQCHDAARLGLYPVPPLPSLMATPYWQTIKIVPRYDQHTLTLATYVFVIMCEASDCDLIPAFPKYILPIYKAIVYIHDNKIVNDMGEYTEFLPSSLSDLSSVSPTRLSRIHDPAATYAHKFSSVLCFIVSPVMVYGGLKLMWKLEAF